MPIVDSMWDLGGISSLSPSLGLAPAWVLFGDIM